MTVRECVTTIERAILCVYNEQREALAVARQVVSALLGYNFSQLVLNYDSECNIPNLDEIITKLQASCPVQYIVGQSEFCSLTLHVQPGVLIPRPETEELVMQIINSSKTGATVLDVGTGSGAIAIAIAKGVAQSKVTAIDISDTALGVAAKNAQQNGVDITLLKRDALGDFSDIGKFDIIVSNPPYIPESDYVSMRANVVDYEPHIALFVPNDDTLCFYRSIAKNALKMLNSEGSLYFEIYEHFGEQIVSMLEQMGFRDVTLAKDIFGKSRMVWCKR